MNPTREAGYLYFYSKDLTKLTKQIKTLAAKKAPDQKKLEKLIKRHQEVLKRINHHYTNYIHSLQNYKSFT